MKSDVVNGYAITPEHRHFYSGYDDRGNFPKWHILDYGGSRNNNVHYRHIRSAETKAEAIRKARELPQGGLVGMRGPRTWSGRVKREKRRSGFRRRRGVL